ncbi:leucine-rich repeat receptor-like protein kinase family protein, partial [Striga asiatica]
STLPSSPINPATDTTDRRRFTTELAIVDLRCLPLYYHHRRCMSQGTTTTSRSKAKSHRKSIICRAASTGHGSSGCFLGEIQRNIGRLKNLTAFKYDDNMNFRANCPVAEPAGGDSLFRREWAKLLFEAVCDVAAEYGVELWSD